MLKTDNISGGEGVRTPPPGYDPAYGHLIRSTPANSITSFGTVHSNPAIFRRLHKREDDAPCVDDDDDATW